ncbi:MAG: hypothetical protein V1837_06110 [Candidatus Woesearchaeota archaeon]
MLHKYHRRTIYLLLVILVVFALIFISALFNLGNNKAMFNIGIPVKVEDITVMLLSIAAIVRALVSLVQMEHRKELVS